ncbi:MULTISPECIES: hypothetical protein [Streptomyces]|uniref:Uncharacterized protein n=1 Tax=Streptomyces sudanensis TaxID=436397 RepID=A0ABY4TBA1_9ACTN|nr:MULTISPECIES: hypothetical protein [Streptomyces]URN16236.1 hypothetical protein MW084_10055 [Streptomyces sudanensis]
MVRSLLTALLAFFLPARGRRRLVPQAPGVRAPAAGVRAPQAPAFGAPVPRYAADAVTRRLITTCRVISAGNLRRRHGFVRGEDVPLVRPYLAAYERAHGIHWQEAAA